ncbi:MAG: hypothetical protein ACYC3S_02980 [Chloroflexota bacterium]
MLRIAAFWLEQDPERVEAVLTAIRRRSHWIANGKWELGNAIPGLARDYRWYLERTYGYKVYCRIDGDPPSLLSVIAVRHSRQHPLSASTLRQRGK